MEEDIQKLFSKRFWTQELPCHFEFRNPQPPFPLHTHDFYELVIIYSGSGIHYTAEQEYSITEEDVILVPPELFHGYKSSNNLVLMNILICTDFIENEDNDLQKINNYKILFNQRHDIKKLHLNKMQLFELRAIIESMQGELTSQGMGYSLQITSFLLQLLVFLLRVYNNPAYPTCEGQNRSVELIRYVEKNFDKEITMEQLTQVGAMSESSVLRTFKHITGYAPFVYQLRLRMFATTSALIETSEDITSIAYRIGFNDSNYFSRYFKKFVGISPREYRKKFHKD